MPDIVGTLKPPRLSAAPSSPANGQMYYDTGLNQLLYWNGTTWIAGSGGGGGGGGLTPVAVSAPYTASVGQLVLMTGANTVTLPAAPAAGAVVAVEALTATATVQRGGTDTINYASTPSLTSVGVAVGTQLNFTYLSGVWYAAQGSAAPANAARASRVAAFAPAASTWTKVPLDTITHDAGGNFSVANGRYVCPMAGVYDVFGALEFSESATATYTQMGIAFYKNGVLYSSNVSFFAVQTVMSMSIADKIQCNAGDYLELWAYNSQATGLVATVNANWLSVSLLK